MAGRPQVSGQRRVGDFPRIAEQYIKEPASGAVYVVTVSMQLL
jgi:hypothetical protein